MTIRKKKVVSQLRSEICNRRVSTQRKHRVSKYKSAS